jgi:hypothetical protein
MTELVFKRLNVESLHDFLDYFDHQAFVDNEKWAGCYCQFYLNDPAINGSQPTSKELNRQSACDRVGSGGEGTGECVANKQRSVISTQLVE